MLGPYLVALRRHPGLGWRLLAAGALTTGNVLRNGVVSTIVLVTAVAAVALPVGWLRFRRTGRV